MLMDAQCWLWGQDIRRPDGNLLVAYGMHRGQWEGDGHSTYYQKGDRDSTVILWSGGMLLADVESSVVIPRHGLAPRLLPGFGTAPFGTGSASLDARNAAEHVASTSLALDHPRTVEAFRWMRDYEAWVACKAGDGWRALCAVRWIEAEEEAQRLSAEVGVEYEPLPPLPADGLVTYWEALSRATGAAIVHPGEGN